MEYIIVIIATLIVGIPIGYYIGLWFAPRDIEDIEQAWDHGFKTGTSPDLNVGPSEFDLLIEDLNPVRKDPNHFKKSRGF